MRRVFLDVGAHLGETLAEVRRPCWGFDRIVCFEPASACWSAIRSQADSRVTLVEGALWTTDGELLLHDPGTIGASLAEAKARGSTTEVCRTFDAAAWFDRWLNDGDLVFMKVNVEGAECDLLEHLHRTGRLGRVRHLLVHFDVRKIPGQEHRELETVRLLDEVGIDWVDADHVMFGRSHAAKTRNWLLYAEGGRATRWIRQHPVRWIFRLRQHAYRLRERSSR